MAEPPPFQPGRFAPVIEIVLAPTSTIEDIDVDYTGLLDITRESIWSSHRAAQAFGTGLGYDPTFVESDAEVTYHFLAARNLAEQLKVDNRYPKASGALIHSPVEVLEPIAKAYNYYGHLDVEGKRMLARDAERQLAQHLVNIMIMATQGRSNVGSAANNVTAAQTASIRASLDYFYIDPDGDLAITYQPLLSEVKRQVAVAVLGDGAIDPSVRSTVAVDILSCGNFYSLNTIVHDAERRYALTAGLIAAAIANRAAPPGALQASLRILLGDNNYAVVDGGKVPNAKVVGSVNRASRIVTRITGALRARMRHLSLARYETGSRAQLAVLRDGILQSPVHLGLDEITLAVAISMAKSSAFRYAMIPNRARESVVYELVEMSVIK